MPDPYENFLTERIRNTFINIEQGGQEVYPWDSFDIRQMEGMKRAYQDALFEYRNYMKTYKKPEKIEISEVEEAINDLPEVNKKLITKTLEAESKYTSEEVESLIRKALVEVGFNFDELCEMIMYTGTKPAQMIISEFKKPKLKDWLKENIRK